MILDVIPIFLFIVVLVLLFLMRKQFATIKANQDRQDEVDTLREEISRSEQDIRDEVRSIQRNISETLTSQLQSTGEMLGSYLTELGKAQTRGLENVTQTTHNLMQSNETRIENVRKAVDGKLQTIQEVFVEMQGIALDVQNLRGVLTNVSTRGAWGEVQLDGILKQILSPEQYNSQVQLRTGSESVDYAVRFPGNDPNTHVWLPIDSKFPLSDYERLLKAAEEADKEKEQSAIKDLLKTVRGQAKSISEKYILAPTTTEFAIMFLPIEGLYSEVLRQPGETAELLQEYSIIVAGPTTLTAILISLRAGFKTLALQEHSIEIGNLLAAVKTEFGAYHNALRLTQKQLNQASNNLEEAEKRSQEVVRKLKGLEALPPAEAAEKLGLPETQ